MANATPTNNAPTKAAPTQHLHVRWDEQTTIFDRLNLPHGDARVVMAAMLLNHPRETVTAIMRWAPGAVPARVRDALLKPLAGGAAPTTTNLAELHQPRTEYAGDPSNPDEPITYLVCVRCTELAAGDEVEWPCDTAVEAGLDKVTLTGQDAGFSERSPF